MRVAWFLIGATILWLIAYLVGDHAWNPHDVALLALGELSSVVVTVLVVERMLAEWRRKDEKRRGGNLATEWLLKVSFKVELIAQAAETRGEIPNAALTWRGLLDELRRERTVFAPMLPGPLHTRMLLADDAIERGIAELERSPQEAHDIINAQIIDGVAESFADVLEWIEKHGDAGKFRFDIDSSVKRAIAALRHGQPKTAVRD